MRKNELICIDILVPYEFECQRVVSAAKSTV